MQNGIREKKKSNQKDGGRNMGGRGDHVFLKRETESGAGMMEIREKSRWTGLQIFEFSKMRPQIIRESDGIDGGFIAEVAGATADRVSIGGGFCSGGRKKFINGHFHPCPAITGATTGFRERLGLGVFGRSNSRFTETAQTSAGI